MAADGLHADIDGLSPAESAFCTLLAPLTISEVSRDIDALAHLRIDTVRPDSDTAYVLYIPGHSADTRSAPVISRSMRVVIHDDLATRHRSSLLRIIDACIAFLRRLLALMICALIRMGRVCAFPLLILAVSRRYGQRSEPGDHVFPGNLSSRKFQGSYLGV